MAINLAFFEEATGSSISTTEYSFTNNSTTIATQTTKCVIEVWIDFVNMVAGDEYLVALREKVVTGGTQRKMTIANPIGVQDRPLVWSSSFIVGVGWDVTVQLITGSARTVTWSIRGITE